MSVINQMLNQLEQRGANAAPELMVRAVPPARRSLVGPLLLLLGLTATGSAAWLYAGKPPVAAPKPALPVVAEGQVTVPEPELLPPASRLSFELSSVSLPSSLREARNVTPSAEAPAPRPAGKPQPMAIPDAPVALSASAELPLKQVSPAQRADAEFRRGIALMQQGRISEAIASYEMALQLDAGLQVARQALVALLLEGKRGADAERVLQEGLKSRPEQTGFAMLLARLQVERGALEQAATTLEKSLPYADNQADYQAFVAALLQRQNRHKEAINHYQIALQLVSGNGVWLMGYGISLQALQRNADAKEAFRRALDSQTLGPDLQKFVQQKLKSL
jgi:MSHA biogenesis protein MshN